MKSAQWITALAILTLALARAEDNQIPVRVVVVTTFEIGDDISGIGEFQHWAADFPLNQIIAFPQGYHPLRYNSQYQVLGMVTGEGKSHAAASIMALGMDRRFDLSKAYWIVAGIAGVNPNRASVASAAWAKYVVDGELSFTIDARDSARLVDRDRTAWAFVAVPTTSAPVRIDQRSLGLPA